MTRPKLSDLPAALLAANASALASVHARTLSRPAGILAPSRPVKVKRRAGGKTGLRRSGYAAAFAGCCPVAPFTEFPFHPVRKWRFDLCWPHVMLAVEVDGGLYVNGGHSRGKAREGDMEKDAHAMIAGWRVLRVSTDHVQSGQAVAWVKAIIAPKPLQSVPEMLPDDARERREHA